jgi:ribose transport system ATP-binding protein
MSDGRGASDAMEEIRRTEPNLVIAALSKTFPGTKALDSADLTVARGELLSLCGGNGSGKSTMIKILSGVIAGDPGGLIHCGGIEARSEAMTPKVAHEMGIRVVHQDLGIFPELTVAENFALGSRFPTSGTGRIHWSRLQREANDLIERFQIPTSPRTRMGRLSRAVQTQIAIARALHNDVNTSSVLITDEPTASLSETESEQLLSKLTDYAAAGQAIIFVSHRLDEVLRISDSIAIVKDGVVSVKVAASELDEAQLIERMVGRHVARVTARPRDLGTRRSVLKARNISAGPLVGVSIDVAEGEIVGVAGLLGSGRSELLRVIFGDLAMREGELRVNGVALGSHTPSQAMACGIGMVPENRAVDGVFHSFDVSENINATVIDKFFVRGSIRRGAMLRSARALVHEYGIKTPSVKSHILTLSGGNQQKVLVARWLQRDPALLLLDEPTVGVDVRARAEIYDLVRAAAARGTAVLLVASDFGELVQIVDRAVVLNRGRITAELGPDEISVHRLTELAHAGGPS